MQTLLFTINSLKSKEKSAIQIMLKTILQFHCNYNFYALLKVIKIENKEEELFIKRKRLILTAFLFTI